MQYILQCKDQGVIEFIAIYMWIVGIPMSMGFMQLSEEKQQRSLFGTELGILVFVFHIFWPILWTFIFVYGIYQTLLNNWR